jgi:hypothetical protein
MTNVVEVVSTTQVLTVEAKEQTINISEQRLIVDPATQQATVLSTVSEISVAHAPASVGVINAGPPGPPGFSIAPSNEAQAAFFEANGLTKKDVTYVDGLPTTIEYFDELDVLTYTSTLVYSSGLPSVVSLERQSDNQVFTKTVTYVGGLPISVEWATL